MKDYYYDQEVDFNDIEVTIEKVKGIGITHLEDNYGYNYFKGSDIASLLKVHNDVPKSFTIGKVIEADKLFDIEGVLKYDEKTNTATKYSPYWLTLEALDNAFKNSRYYTNYVCETLNLLNDMVSCDNNYTFIYQDKNELMVEDKLEVNDKYGAVISSRLIAQQLGKEHKNVTRDIENILTSSNLSTLFIPSSYNDSRNRTQRDYLLTKDGFTLYMFNIQGYNDFKIEYINRFNEMENQMNEMVKIETEKRVKELEKENFLLRLSVRERNAKKILEKYAKEPVLYTATEVANEINEEVVSMNKWLGELGVQYKKDGSWMICDEYAANGFTVVKTCYTHYGYPQTYSKWTEKGKEFIHSLYKQTRLDIA